MLYEHKDKILIELAGHDHFGCLRAAKTPDGQLYHNMFIAPSVTPWYSNNPGVTSFEISEDLVPLNLRSTFLNLKKTYGKDTPTPEEELEFR